MKLKDILGEAIAFKLQNVAFKSPQKNVATWMFYEATKKNVEFIKNEVAKREFGENNKLEYELYMKELLNQDVVYELPRLNILMADFEEINCCYPTNKALWLTGSDIKNIHDFSCEQLAEIENKAKE